MSSLLASLGLDRLSVGERLRLLDELRDSIVAEAGAVDIPPSHRDELDRRLEEAAADPDAGSPWPEVMARLLNQP
jgi:putative addiction module component (TIGR02574 family)